MNSNINIHEQSQPLDGSALKSSKSFVEEEDHHSPIRSKQTSHLQSPGLRNPIILEETPGEEKESDFNIHHSGGRRAENYSGKSQGNTVDLSQMESLKTLLGQKMETKAVRVMITEQELSQQLRESQALNDNQDQQMMSKKKKPSSIKGLFKLSFANPK